jgi:hypothetical protein
MTAQMATIDQTMLEKLSASGSLQRVRAVAQTGGWRIVVRYGTSESTLVVRRGNVRVWPKLDTLVNFLVRMQIAEFEVDATAFQPGTHVARPRLDAAERMRAAHEAAAYDRWFKGQVQAGLDDSRPRVPHEVVLREMAEENEALLASIARDSNRGS